ncbi:hypothetical protein BTVI_66724 [Pitangus sulphuratus]|nr:hypothetical protein BTVI_66724 [Pitangus sulphuratus]
MEPGLFLVGSSNRTRADGQKLWHKKFHLNMKKNFFTVCWNRLQGDNLAEGPEDVSMVSQASEPAVSDSDAQVPGVETLTEDIDEFQSASQVAGSCWIPEPYTMFVCNLSPQKESNDPTILVAF